MLWADYYDRFDDLSLSTQKSYSYKLTDYGSPEEVFEVLSEFAFHDEKFASRFAVRAMDAGVRFTPDQALEITTLIDKTVLSRMAETAYPPFNKEQLEEIYMLIEDESFDKIQRHTNINIFEDNEPVDDSSFFDVEETPSRGPGFFGTLLAILGAVSIGNNSSPHKHNGRCNGDCANCPPHYGYRYGRWYYGHDHVHGCEFGGNKGSGSRD